MPGLVICSCLNHQAASNPGSTRPMLELRVESTFSMLTGYMGVGDSQGFPAGSNGKVSACNAGDLGSIPGLGSKIPWRRKWQPTPVLLPGKFHGRRSLVGYSP